jgi:hypothetical protein
MGGYVEAIQQYNETGQIKFVEWDDENKVLSWIPGVIPITDDYQETLKMDFITYDGDPSDPAGPSDNWSSIGKDTPDGWQMLYATPLTRQQMWDIGFNRPCPWDLDESDVVGVVDLLALLAAWGTDPGGPPDFNDDGVVGIADLLELSANWGACPGPQTSEPCG